VAWRIRAVLLGLFIEDVLNPMAGGGELMKPYALRNESRTPVQCQFYCVTEDSMIEGMVRDLSATGVRVTVAHPMPVGVEKPIFITLQEGGNCHHLLIPSAVVRWTYGHEAGWEFWQMDELDRAHLTLFLQQRQQAAVSSAAFEVV
jgi:c-di-GMP-binding flagellar brake protein YcgR